MAEAGRYVLKDLFWDRRTNAVTEQIPIFHRHMQGEVLELDEGEATRLVDAGSVEPEGERERLEVEAARARLRAALAAVPDELRGRIGLPSDEDLDRLAEEGIPQESLTVHTAPGLTNPGHPKYAAAAHGEGGVGEGLDEADAGQEGDAPVATTGQLDETQAKLSLGTRDDAGARQAVAEQAKRSDLRAGRAGNRAADKAADKSEE